MMEDGTVVSLYITVAITVLDTPGAQELHVVMDQIGVECRSWNQRQQQRAQQFYFMISSIG